MIAEGDLRTIPNVCLTFTCQLISVNIDTLAWWLKMADVCVVMRPIWLQPDLAAFRWDVPDLAAANFWKLPPKLASTAAAAQDGGPAEAGPRDGGGSCVDEGARSVRDQHRGRVTHHRADAERRVQQPGQAPARRGHLLPCPCGEVQREAPLLTLVQCSSPWLKNVVLWIGLVPWLLKASPACSRRLNSSLYHGFIFFALWLGAWLSAWLSASLSHLLKQRARQHTGNSQQSKHQPRVEY